MSRRALCGVVAALLGLFVPTTARADLEWVAPPGCSSRERVLDVVRRALASRAEGLSLAARAVVETTPSGVRVSLRIGNGERTLEAATCDEVADAVGLILALAVHPSRVSPEASDKPVAAPTPAPVPAPTPAPVRRAAAPEGPSASIPVFSLDAGPVLDFGTLPGLSGGVGLSVGARRGWLRFEVAGAAFAPRHATVSSTSVGGDLFLVSGVARGCVLPQLGRFEVGGCVGLGIDSMAASAVGTTTAQDASARWGTLEGSARVTYVVVRGFALGAELGVHVPLSRPTFVIEGAGDVHRPAALSARPGIRLELRFP